MSRTPLRWGILSTGRIAGVFAEAINAMDDAELVAVGSRSQASADEFADRYNIPQRHPSYEDLAANPDVDAIYVATPHVYHAANSILCIEHGKAVLCEKPLTINAAQARQIADAAQKHQVFVMEAMWTRFLPAIVRLRELLAEGAIGEPRILQSDFALRARWDPQGRLLNRELGGGALLDLGIYPVSFAHMVFGPPTGVHSLAHIGETGVDEQNAIVLQHDKGALSLLTSATRTYVPSEARIFGTEGRIRVPVFLKGEKLIIDRDGKDIEEIDLPVESNGYNYEAAEVARCIAAGKFTSDVMPLSESIRIMETMDEVRRAWGLSYPGD